MWICLHGYGHLAAYFARKFHALSTRVHLVFPEGAHRFYLSGSSGRVGASWMTKESRLTDIANQCVYLDAIYDAVGISEDIEVTVLGFSQGAATASRWAGLTEKRLNRLILWASVFPPDLSVEMTQKIESLNDVLWVFGDEDPYLQDLDYKELAVLMEMAEEIRFKGAHEIRPQELTFIADRIGI